MKSTYLLPNKFKFLGWLLFSLGLVAGFLYFLGNYESDLLEIKVLSIYNGDSFFQSGQGFFKIIENSIVDELIALAIIIGGLMVGFSKEKIEDEFIYKLRNDSLIWAILFNYAVLIFTIIFIYDFTFFNVLVFNMFTPLVFFFFRFNFLKLRSRSNEE